MLSCDGKQGRVVPALCPRSCYKCPGIWKDQLGRGCTILIPWGSARHEFDIRIWSAGTANKPVNKSVPKPIPRTGEQNPHATRATHSHVYESYRSFNKKTYTLPHPSAESLGVRVKHQCC